MEGGKKKKKTWKEFYKYLQLKAVTVAEAVGQALHFCDLQALYETPGQLTPHRTSVLEDTNQFYLSHTSKKGKPLNDGNLKKKKKLLTDIGRT